MTQRIINFTDIESTGLNEPEHRIVELCCQLYDLDTEEHLKTWVWLIDPERSITPKAQKVHGITAAHLAGKPTLEQLAPVIRGVFNPAYANVAHNGDHFDFPFIKREMMRVGHPVTFARTFDTMVEGRFATANGKNPKLGELATCLDVPYDPDQAHGADYDTSVMAKCFFAGKRLGWFNI